MTREFTEDPDGSALSVAIAVSRFNTLITERLLAGAHLAWQVRRLKIDDPEICLALFRANRDTGALVALAFAVANWFG